MKTALYMRMSTDKQENSIASQKEVLERYAKMHHMKIVHEYVDEGISGRAAEKRPAFMQMIEDSDKDMFEAVLVYDSSRFARNLEESIVYKSALKKNNVELISATEPTLDEDSALITDAMLGALNEMYSRKLSKAVKRGMVYNAQNGNYQVPPPFGYKKEKGVMTIIDSEAEVIKKIYSLFIERPSWHSVAVRINATGRTTRKGAFWGSRDIKRILTNPAYIGYVTYAGETYKGNHSPIIDNGTYEKVQKLISEKPPTHKARPEMLYKHWLSGILKCGHCGHAMSCLFPKRGSSFYRCHGHACGKCTHSNFVLVKDIEEIVLNSFKNLISSDKIDNYEIFIRCNNKKDEYSELQTALKKVKAKLERHKAAYANGVDSLEEYKENKDKCILEEKEINKRLNKLADTSIKEEDINKLKEDVKSVIDFLNDESKSIEEKSLAVKTIVQRVVYNREAGELAVYYFL